MKRIFFAAILIAAALIGCTGCKSNEQKSVNELALKHMEQKYGEKFEYVKPAGASYTGTRNFFATGHVLVQIDNFKDEDKRVFRDNYIALKYEQKTQDWIKEIVDKEFPESKVYYNAPEHALSADLPGNATFEQFLADPETILSTVIAVKYSDYSNKDQLKAIVEKISAASAAQRINLAIHILGDKEYNDFYSQTHNETVLNGDNFIKYAHFYREKDTKWLEIYSRGNVLDEKIEY